jgi:hypothetical protein
VLFVSTSAEPLDSAQVTIERRDGDSESGDALERVADQQQLDQLQLQLLQLNQVLNYESQDIFGPRTIGRAELCQLCTYQELESDLAASIFRKGMLTCFYMMGRK